METTHIVVGGVGARQARLAEELPARGWEPVFAFTRGARFHDPSAYRRVLPALTGLELDARTGSSEGRRLAVEKAIRGVRPRVVFPGAVRDAWVVAEELKRNDGPRIVYGLPGIDLNSLAFIRRHQPFIDAAFGVSPFTACLLSEYCGMPAELVSLVPTGVQPAQKHTAASPSVPVKLLYVGRFDPDKRALDAAALALELTLRGLEFEMTLVGSGVLGGELQEAVELHAGRVRIVPPVTQRTLYDEFYPAADAVLLFSPTEGLPNAVLEGMAHGLVPITSDFEGRSELGLLRDNETALIFGVGDIGAAADRVLELVKTPDLKARVGGAAREIIERERSVEAMTNMFVSVLERATGGEGRLGPHRVVPLEGRSRLRDLFGPRLAERVRRALGVSWAHRDASEWPLIGNGKPDELALEESRLRFAIERCRGGARGR